MGLKDTILNAKFHTEKINAFETSFTIREMTAKEREEYEVLLSDWQNNKSKLKHIRARLLMFCIIDDNGNRVFGETDLDALSGLPAGEVDRVWNRIRILSGLETEDTEKNS